MMPSFRNYFRDMINRGRVIVVYDDNVNVGWCTYYVGNRSDIDRFHNRGLFETVDDREEGPMIYIDYLFSLRWNRDVRSLVYKLIKMRHPSFKYGVWFRPSSKTDRMMVWEVK